MLIFYKMFGKVGLFVWIAIANIITNIQTVKLVEIFGVETALGTILYGSTFLATDIINERYGLKEAQKSIIFAFASMIIMTIFMYIALLYNPSINDFASPSLNVIFTLNIRITCASVVGFVLSQLCDTWLYHKIKEKYQELWIRNNGSTMISQFFDTILFTVIAYYGLISLPILIEMGLFMYVFKFFIALIDTPFMYIAVNMKNNEF